MTAQRSVKRLFRLAAAVVAGGTAGFLFWNRAPCPAHELFERAAAAIDRGDRSVAIASLDALLECAPDHHRGLLYRGQLAREMGDSQGALEYFRRVKTDSAKDAGVARFLEGTILLERNLARDAEQAFLRSTELHPTYPQPRERLAGLYATQLRTEDCRAQLEALRRLRPWQFSELVVWQICTGMVHSPQKAIPQLENFAEADPRDVHSRLGLARYYMYLDRTDEAADLLRGLLPTVSGTALQHVRGLLAEALVLQMKFAEAREVLGDSLPSGAAHRWLWRAHGFYAAAVEDWETAVVCLQRVVRDDPDDITALYRLGLALERTGRHDEARRILERTRLTEELYTSAARLLGGDPSRTDLMFEMVMDVSRLFVRLDRSAEAIAWLEQAERWRPRDREIDSLLSLAARDKRLALKSGRSSEPERPLPESVAVATSPARTPAPDRVTDPSVKPIPPRIQLVDRQRSAGLDFQCFNGHSALKYLLDTTGGGVAVLDYDGDGRPDLYFPQGCKIPYDAADRTFTDRLYRNRGDGTFEDVTDRAGPGGNQYGQGCAAGDYDNDGFSDLFVANFGTNIVYRNNGDGTFSDVTTHTGIGGERWSASLALADLDSDGLLDLYVATYVLDPLKVCRDRNGVPFTCSPANYKAEADVLYRNRGDGTFEDISASAGILAPDGKGLGVIVADLNDDGRPDIYVANDGTPNFLFRNLGAESPSGGLLFEEVGMLSGAAVSDHGSPQAGMGIACADLNGDGRLDLYVTNFLDDVNTLYLNHGEFMFSDATRTAGLAAPTRDVLGFGTQAVDLDLDGKPELFVANGHIDDFRARGEPWKMRPQLFSSLGDGAFADISAASGDYFRGEYLGRGVARLDWNGDGRPDLIVVHQDRQVALLTNETEAVGNHLILTLRGTRSNRDAIGARVAVTVDGRTRVYEQTGGDGYMASNERSILLGLAGAQHAESIRIRWPSGGEQLLTDVPADESLILIEGRRQPISAPATRSGKSAE